MHLSKLIELYTKKIEFYLYQLKTWIGQENEGENQTGGRQQSIYLSVFFVGIKLGKFLIGGKIDFCASKI